MSLAQTARQLIAKFGEDLELRTPPAVPAFDPVTGAAQTATAGATYVRKGVPTRYKANEVDGATILASDVRLLVGVEAEAPAVGWLALVGGVSHRVMDAQRIRQSGADVLFILQLRAN